MKTFLLVLVIASTAAVGGWWVGTRPHHAAIDGAPATAAKKILRYQSPMHPWVKSDRPGKCTVCGMELVPIYEGGGDQDAATTGLVLLPEGSPSISRVETAPVKLQPLVRTLKVAGTIEDDESKHRILSASTGGRIEKLYVNFEGAEVQAGQPLATYYSKELLSAVREYKVAFRQGPSPLLTATEMRLRQLGLSQEQVAKAPQRPETEILVEILAPITGTVVKRYVYEGQYVQEGEKLFELGDFSTMWFQFMAYEQDLPFLKEGLPVTISTPSLPGRTLSSVVKFINPNIDAATRSAKVRVELQNPTSAAGLHRQHEVLHQLYAEAEVFLEAPEVLAVPRHAVLWSGSNPRVYVEQSPGVYEPRQVILGRAGDAVWEILEGVKVGERVVASANMLIDGQAQLNNLAATDDESSPHADAALQMPAAEHEAAEKYLTAAAAVTAALSEDSLAGYNAALSRLPALPAGLAIQPPAKAPDLVAARREFLPVSQAIADYAQTVRGQFAHLKIFRCPMSNQMGGGTPQNARWIQFTPDLRNPYMGREMLECGVEVK